VVLEGARPGANARIIRFSAEDDAPMEKRFRFFGPLTTAFLRVHGLMVYQKQFPLAFHAASAEKLSAPDEIAEKEL
jgi:hypothetical protein